MKKIAVLLLALLLIPSAALGEGVKVSEVTHSVFYAPQYAALGLGFFEEEGLQIDLMNGGGADKVMTSVLTGEADIGLAGPEACIYVLLAEHDDAPRVFAQLTCRDGSFLVGREAEDFSWENLRGKQIIGGRKGGMPEMTLEYVMKQHGVVPGVDAQVDTSVQFNMMAGAFIGGDADYVTLFEPTATEAELAGQCVVLTSIGKESGEIPYTAYFAAQSLLNEKADLIQRFTSAVYRGQQWVYGHTDAEVAEVLLSFFPDTSLEVMTQVVARYREIGAWNPTPVMKRSALERLETVMESAGELEKRVEFDQLVDNSFAFQTLENN
ncbi:MAG: ABC transporter substrate-binding protein [Clostridia bacterium]|nr:ABC transporter substrate-binding protein [Clostridia bacterium]